MSLKDEALELDKEAEKLGARLDTDFVRTGIVMHKICEYDRWRSLTDPKTGQPFRTLEAWVTLRFGAGRSTAFAARNLYRALKEAVPDTVLFHSEIGSLKVLRKLPSSAQKNPEIQEMATQSTTSEFQAEMHKRYPDHLKDEQTTWCLRPTISQAEVYDRFIEDVVETLAKTMPRMSREEAFEYFCADYLS
jgi:hypothetical protein